jgi:hypothetical protein
VRAAQRLPQIDLLSNNYDISLNENLLVRQLWVSMTSHNKYTLE